MAEVITRFKLETTQFDSKIRDAAKGLAEITKQASLAGNEFAKYTNKNVEAARAFGNIATSATNAKDKVKELVDAYNKVANAYNALTKEQQQSDFGKAMAESMTTLKSRIADAKSEMYDTGGILSSLKDKFTVNIDALKLFNMGLEAAKAALDVAKDAFFASEANLDEWGRVVASSEALYEGFLTAINTGDISGYLTRINQIVSAARDAYDELDRLSTQKAINNAASQAQRTENERFRAMLRTGKYIAPNDGRRATMAEGQILTDAQKQRIAQMLENGLQKTNSFVRSEIDQTTKAIGALYNQQAINLGMSVKEFRSGTSSMQEFDKRMQGYELYKQFEREHTIYDSRAAVSHRDSAINPYASYKAWGVFKDDGALFQKINELINQRAGLQSQNYANIAQMYKTINSATGGGGGGGRGGAGGSSEPSILDFNKILGKSLTGSVDLKEVKDQLSPFQMMLPEIEKNILGIKDADLGGALAELGNKKVVAEIATVTKEIEQQKMAFDMAAQSAATFGSALAGIQDPSIKAAGTVIQAIANIVLGFSQAAAQASSMGPYGWIAYLAAGMGAMATTISTIHSLTGFAEGGEIKGNSYSGDQIPIMANAGEIVLNQAQQSNVAGALRGNGFGQMRIVGVLQGTQLLMCIDNTTKSMGMGEIATFKNSN